MNFGSYLAEEEGGERKFHQQVFIQCLRVGLSNSFFLKYCRILLTILKWRWLLINSDKRKDTYIMFL
jgi:hypothetical protein